MVIDIWSDCYILKVVLVFPDLCITNHGVRATGRASSTRRIWCGKQLKLYQIRMWQGIGLRILRFLTT